MYWLVGTCQLIERIGEFSYRDATVLGKFKMKNYFFAATFSVSAALSASTSYSATGQQELLLSGPVESVDRRTKTVIVLGHHLTILDSSRILPGHKVNVFGNVGADGLTKAEFVQDTNIYAGSGDIVVLQFSDALPYQPL